MVGYASDFAQVMTGRYVREEAHQAPLSFVLMRCSVDQIQNLLTRSTTVVLCLLLPSRKASAASHRKQGRTQCNRRQTLARTALQAGPGDIKKRPRNVDKDVVSDLSHHYSSPQGWTVAKVCD